MFCKTYFLKICSVFLWEVKMCTESPQNVLSKISGERKGVCYIEINFSRWFNIQKQVDFMVIKWSFMVHWPHVIKNKWTNAHTSILLSWVFFDTFWRMWRTAQRSDHSIHRRRNTPIPSFPLVKHLDVIRLTDPTFYWWLLLLGTPTESKLT